MHSSFTVPLRFSRNSEDRTIIGADIKPLVYDLTPAEANQARFADRLVAKPRVDIGKYTCKAVIDWVWMEFEVGHSTKTGKEAQSRWISDKLKPILGKNPMVTGPRVPYDAESWSNYQGADFRIKVQDPNSQKMLKVRDLIHRGWTLARPMRIIGIEVSMDWRSNDQSDQERWEMVAALQRHHFPDSPNLNGPRADLRHTYNHPRSKLPAKEAKKGKSEFVVQNPTRRYVELKNGERMYGASAEDMENGKKVFEIDESVNSRSKSDRDVRDPKVRRGGILGDNTIQAPFIDGTLYLGERGAPVMFSIQNKVKDGRNSKTEPPIELGPKDRRARLEVRLLGEAVSKYGFNTLEGLFAFRFEALREGLFEFWLPTFWGSPEEDGSLKGVRLNAKGQSQRKAFVIGGLYAHQIREEALRLEEKENRNRWRNSGLEVSSMNRSGRGKTGKLKAWSELNEQCRDALYNMSRRWDPELLFKANEKARGA